MDINDVYTSLPPGALKRSKSLNLHSKPKKNNFVSYFLSKNLPQNRLTKGEYTDEEYASLRLDFHKPKKNTSTLGQVQKKKFKLNSAERKKLTAFDLKNIKDLTYEKFLPLHELWLKYMGELIDFRALTETSLPNAQAKCLKADYHGCIMKVVRSKCPSYVGTCGIIVKETKHMFQIITRDNSLKSIPKLNSVFGFEVHGYMFTLYGNTFVSKSSERCSKKFKRKPTIDL